MNNLKEEISRIIKEEFESDVMKYPMDIPLPEDVIKINKIMHDHGYNLYLVGGSIRDAILGQKIKDYDLATDALPDNVQGLLSPVYKTIETGKAFGVINVITPSGEFEVATFREDLEYKDSRRPEGVKFSTIEKDVLRRDLTINALFYDINKKEVVDMVGGVNDLKNGIVRAVGNPVDRFSEDRLRILRVIRFAARMGSKIEPGVDAVLKKDSSLEGISKERIRDEFIKGIKSAKSVIYFFELLTRYNLLQWIFGGLKYSLDPIEEHDYIVVIAYTIRTNNVQVAKKEFHKLTYTLDEIEKIAFLLNFQNINTDNVYKLKKAQIHSKISNDSVKKFSHWIALDSKVVDTFINWNLSVQGADLLAKGLSGPALGAELEKIEKEIFLKSLGKN